VAQLKHQRGHSPRPSRWATSPKQLEREPATPPFSATLTRCHLDSIRITAATNTDKTNQCSDIQPICLDGGLHASGNQIEKLLELRNVLANHILFQSEFVHCAIRHTALKRQHAGKATTPQPTFLCDDVDHRAAAGHGDDTVRG
jgi:hypothetical protein